jgi:hypothetical protein
MKQLSLLSPGEIDHADRQLRTIAYLIERGHLCLASEVVEQLAPANMLPPQERRFEELALELESLLVHGLEPRPACRVLPFRRNASALRVRASAASSDLRSSSLR